MTATVNEEADALFGALFSPSGNEDPYPYYARLRRIAPVYVNAAGVCFISSYAGCHQVLNGREFGVDDRWDAMRADWRDHPAMTRLASSIAVAEPPQHTRLRKLVAGAFTRRRVEELRDSIDRHVESLMEAMALQGASGQPVDFVDSFARPLPVAIIGSMLGVTELEKTPANDLISAWLPAFEPGAGEAVVARGDDAAEQLWELFGAVIEERRHDPGDDLVSALIDSTSDGDRLATDELVSMVVTLFLTGSHTMTKFLGNSIVVLNGVPDQSDLLRADPRLATTAVEELLRFEAVAQLIPRVARAEVTIDDVVVPEGTAVIAMLGAASRDPSIFEEPDRCDIRRNPNPHLAFGVGIHHCIGALLARIEGQIALPALLQRFPHLTIPTPGARTPGITFRGFESLPVIVSPHTG
jgi:cytochrome P450